MSCNLDRPTPQALYDRIRDNFSINVLGGFDIVPESIEHYVVANDYAMAEEFYSIAEMQWRARDPRYACCDDLYDMAAKEGFYPRPSGFAQGYVTITGTPGSAIPLPLDVQVQGQTYRATGTVPAVIPLSGEVPVRVQAIVPGIEGNIAVAGSTGNLISAAPGIDTEVRVSGNAFCGGSSEEDCEAFRQRYIEERAYKPRQTDAWLRSKLLEWPCVTRVVHREGACCTTQGVGGEGCGCNSCTNALEYYPLFDDTFTCGIPPECVVNDMNDWLFGAPQGRGLGQTEIGVCGKLYAPVAMRVNVRIGGLSCATPTQVAQIRERITNLFRRAEPSKPLTVRAAEILISQVMGDATGYTVAYELLDTDRGGLSPCGDIDPWCDVVPCLSNIIIANASSTQGSC
jgi:hypothetical protein